MGAIAQVIDTWEKAALLLASFAHPVSPDNDESNVIADVLQTEPTLLGIAFDALIHNGTWTVLTTTEIITTRRPIYREGRYLVDFYGRRLSASINISSPESVDTRSVLTAKRFENAVRASTGFGEWKPGYEKLRFENQVLI